MSKPSKKISLKKIMKLFSLFFFIIVLGAFIGLVMCNHLYLIRKINRLKKVEDYSNFVLVLKSKNKCENEEITLFEANGLVYKSDCVTQIYVFYGTTYLTLKEAIEAKYFDVKQILNNMIYDNTMKEDHYEYILDNQENKSYSVDLIRDNDKKMKEIIFKKLYQ